MNTIYPLDKDNLISADEEGLVCKIEIIQYTGEKMEEAKKYMLARIVTQ